MTTSKSKNDALRSHLGEPNTLTKMTRQVSSRVSPFLDSVSSQTSSLLDRTISPDQRKAVSSRLQTFINQHPKLSWFLILNFIFTGLPIIFFATFCSVIFFGTLIVGSLITLSAAILTTLFWFGLGLLFVLPFLLITTSTAFFVFVAGMIGHRLVTAINSRRTSSSKKIPSLESVSKVSDETKLVRSSNGVDNMEDPQFSELRSGNAEQGTKLDLETAWAQNHPLIYTSTSPST